jgi:hypothetical protein
LRYFPEDGEEPFVRGSGHAKTFVGYWKLGLPAPCICKEHHNSIDSNASLSIL